jgi:ferritin-like metal-binding protein YciE
MKLESLKDLYTEELKDVYSAEKQIVKALPKMIKAATSDELKSAFEDHLAATKTHVERLEQLLYREDAKSRTKKCKGMEGLLDEGEEFISETGDPNVIDAALISAAQRVEHYEIAAYGTLCAYAKTLNEVEALKLLEATLEEEKEADETLSGIAESHINELAAMPVDTNREDFGAQPFTS